MQMQWKILQPDRALVQEIQKHLQCNPITATVLANRKIKSADQASIFIQQGFESLPSPDMLFDIPAAVERITRAIQRNERIMVFGDYDADGVTATAVLLNFLKAAGADVHYHLPHRVNEGYGLLPIHIAQLASPRRVKLIITVDCGSSSVEAVTAAQRFGIDVIITDHHNINGELPGALAIINPKKPDQPDQFDELAGVGVAFYLVIALRAALRAIGWWNNRPEPNLKTYCDLVAIGTIADMVSLRGINRVLVRAGLEQINKNPRPGIQALLSVSGIRHSPINSEDIAYRLGPRINAAGRMAHAKIAFDLINAPNKDIAFELSEELNFLNLRRQEAETSIYHHIISHIDSRPDLKNQKTLLLAGTGWHEGVLGIVATKLLARYHRPVAVVSVKDDMAKGSGRSVPKVDLYAALGKCEYLLEKYGGHKLAAGFTLRTKNIGLLQNAFEAAVNEMLQKRDLCPQLEIDGEIQLSEISPQLLDELEKLAPFGNGNPPPLFMSRDVRVISGAIVGRNHRRMTLCQPNQDKPPIAAIQFNLAVDNPRANSFDRIAFRLQWNRYKGDREIQIIVEAS
jgi:single-stranded-DNA-specific exonuclease